MSLVEARFLALWCCGQRGACNGLFPAEKILRLAIECMSVSNLGGQDGSGSLGSVGWKASMEGFNQRR